MDDHDAWCWLGGLSALTFASFVQSYNSGKANCHVLNQGTTKNESCKAKIASPESKYFTYKLNTVHKEYLAMYFMIRLADWLQGTNMYTLYHSYGMDVGILFVTGFLTSALAGTFVGSWIDRYGRRQGMIIYCMLEVIIQILEHIPNMKVLLLGRVLGGISTALLFSAFESWIITEHKRKELPTESLSRMFSLASIMNGVSAVLAGVLAHGLRQVSGEIGPFRLALVISAAAGLYIRQYWPENYGHNEQPGNKSCYGTDFLEMVRNPAILIIAVSQICFEGSMYTFVAMWVPSFIQLGESNGKARAPIELLFSSLMLALSLGGLLFNRLRGVPNLSITGFILLVTGSASCFGASIVLSSRAVANEAFLSPAHGLFAAFCLFEICCGAFEPWASNLRAEHIPVGVMGSVTALMRVPLNLVVWFGVHLTSVYSLEEVFQFLGVVQSLCSVFLIFNSKFLSKGKRD